MPPKANKIELELKKLSKLDGNKTCANCPEKMPGYVDLTNNIFICTKCSGIHREFQFKAKSVSMSVFTEDDVAALASVGNEAFNAVYLARLNPKETPIPNGNDIQKLKDFIRQKYIEKKWHRDSSSGSAAIGTAASPGQPASSGRLSLNLSKTNSFSQSRRASTGAIDAGKRAPDLMNFPSDPAPSFHSTATTVDPFAESTGSTAASAAAAAAAASFDPFSHGDPFSTPAQFDAFGPSSAATFDAFGAESVPSTASFVDFPPAVPSGATARAHTAAPVIAPMPVVPEAPNVMAKPAANTAPKNFSAFDDLLDLPVAAPAMPQQGSSNPFEAQMGSYPYGAGHQPQYPPPHPHPGYPPQYQAYGHQQPHPGVPAHALPPQNPSAVPPHMHGVQHGAPGAFPNQNPYGPAPGGYGGYGFNAPPSYPHGPAPGAYLQPPHPAAAPFGAAGVPPVPHAAAPAPAPVAQPDPFAAMSDLAWGATGGFSAASHAPPSSVHASAAHPHVSAPGVSGMTFDVAGMSGAQAPPPQPQFHIQSQPPASVNPFDLF